MAKKKITVRRNGVVLHGAAAQAVLKSRKKKARKAAARKRVNPRPATKKRSVKKRSNPRPAGAKATKRKNPAMKTWNVIATAKSNGNEMYLVKEATTAKAAIAKAKAGLKQAGYQTAWYKGWRAVRENPLPPGGMPAATKRKPATKRPAARRSNPKPARRYWYQVEKKRNGVLYLAARPHRNPSGEHPPDAIVKLHEDFLGRPIDGYDLIEVPDYFPADAVNAGDVVAIEYLAKKDHLENGEVIQWRHEFGEEGGELPMMALGPHGEIFLAGGDYFIAPEGIRD
jgi:hypothetical protein